MARKSETNETIENVMLPELDMTDPQVQAIFKAVMAQVNAQMEKDKEGNDPDAARHKRLQESEAKRAQEETMVKLFLDGDKYKDDVYVAYNGRPYLIKRGVPVTVPRGVADVLRNAEVQAQAAAKHSKGLQQQYTDKQASL